ncbi:hypothetical protein DEU56DRAFT_798035 [Suillus clintonianus]|uniref:uncharacterized protein n=1 Tax=Suillus clintonianus TaxID=1904413 RepID=UPI001B872A5E|nr:uncharacterized protein DEU56DRAFT_798035 [Suillus clintonianus]KAG2140661.1 hypothetical protein DEU56DRAFT_798035 [Suillus clintonianus]
MSFAAVRSILQLNTDETQALKFLPVVTQITAKKAVQGSTADLARLVDSIPIPCAPRFSCLVPIFHATLKSVQVPNYINLKTIPAIMGAKWALLGLVKICSAARPSAVGSDTGDSIVTKYIVRRWDEIFPWMRFFARNCLPSPYDVSVTPPRPDLCNVFDATKLCIHPLTFICTSSKEGRHILRSSISVQHYVAQLWVLVGNLKGDVLQGDPGSSTDSLVSMIRTSFTVTNNACISESEDPDKITLPISNYIHAAGGVKPVVYTLLRYIRRITRDAVAVEEPRSWTPSDKSVQHLHLFTAGLHYSFLFLKTISRQDASCRAQLIRQGSIRTMVDAITLILPKILVQTNAEMDFHSQLGLADRQNVLWMGYSYIASAIRDGDDGVTSVCQAIDAGLIQTLEKGVVCPPHANHREYPNGHPPRGRMGDVELLLLLPTFFLYHRVVESIFKHWFRVQSAPMAKREIRDKGLGVALELVLKSSIDAMDHRSVEPINPQEYKCSGPGCGIWTSEFVSKKRRCSGCLISLYCSEKCQRTAWRNGHKKWCQVLRCAVGPWGSRDIRTSLQVIAGFETSEISGMAKDVETRVREAQQQFPAFINKLVLMLDMTVFPPEIHVLPVHRLEQFPGKDPIWPEIADEIRQRSDSPPKGYMFSVVKVHLGKSKFTLFSPSMALRMAFESQYFVVDDSVDENDSTTLGDQDLDYGSEPLYDADGSEDKCYEV